MTSSTAASHRSSTNAFWLIFSMSALMLVMIAGATLAAAPSMRLEVLRASPTSPMIPWAPVILAKPTYTPSPVPTATATPVDTPTPTIVFTDVPATSAVSLDLVSTLPDQAPPDASHPAQPQAVQGGKYILVSISEQHLWAYDNDQLVYSFVASTGMRNSTRVGNFSVLDKIPNAYGSTWNIWMPDWMGIYYSGTLENGIHALPILPSGDILWSGFLGTPISYGCVVLGSQEALQLFNWADIGTPVEIRW